VYSYLSSLATTLSSEKENELRTALTHLQQALDIDIQQQNNLDLKQIVLGSQITSTTSTTTTSTVTKKDIYEHLSKSERTSKGVEHKTNGNSLFNEGKYHEAVEQYNMALDYEPKNCIYLANRAASYQKLGDYNKAIQDCLESIKCDPSYVKSYSRLGHSYSAIGDFQKALEAFEDGLKLEPQNSSLLSERDQLQFKLSMQGMGGIPGMEGMANMAGMADYMNNMKKPPNMNEFMNLMSNPQFLEQINDLIQKNPQFVQMTQQFLQNPEFLKSMFGGVPPDIPGLSQDAQNPFGANPNPAFAAPPPFGANPNPPFAPPFSTGAPTPGLGTTAPIPTPVPGINPPTEPVVPGIGTTTTKSKIGSKPSGLGSMEM